ncbi:hypothetical protein M758_UG048900 [Ceratodon purpureus]|nr:hypothetical protein M758_UG048900 [Ceratodon purpureus]
MCDSTKEAIWLHILLKELEVAKCTNLTIIHCDNQSSVKIAHNHVFHSRTKHIEVQYHYIREQVLAKSIDLQHISTGDQVADLFTKALGKTQFGKLRNQLGLIDTTRGHS